MLSNSFKAKKCFFCLFLEKGNWGIISNLFLPFIFVVIAKAKCSLPFDASLENVTSQEHFGHLKCQSVLANEQRKRPDDAWQKESLD